MTNMPMKSKRVLSSYVPIARQKRSTNAVEFVLYVWQMEDLVRGAGFDLERVKGFLSTGIADDRALSGEMKWMSELLTEMETSGLKEKGHIADAEQVLAELVYLHQTLLNLLKDEQYIKLYEQAKPVIQDLIEKSGGTARNEVEASLNGTYGLLLLRLRKATVSKETEEGVKHLAALLSALAVHYKNLRTGEENASLN